ATIQTGSQQQTALQQQLQQLQVQLAQAGQTNKANNAQQAQAEAELVAMKKQLDERHKAFEQLEQKLRKRKEQIDAAEANVKKAQTDLEKQKQALAAQGANADGGGPDEALIQKLQEMTMRCADLEMKLSQGGGGGGADEAEINRLLDIMADLEQEKAKMQKHIQELTEKLKVFQTGGAMPQGAPSPHPPQQAAGPRGGTPPQQKPPQQAQSGPQQAPGQQGAPRQQAPNQTPQQRPQAPQQQQQRPQRHHGGPVKDNIDVNNVWDEDCCDCGDNHSNSNNDSHIKSSIHGHIGEEISRGVNRLELLEEALKESIALTVQAELQTRLKEKALTAANSKILVLQSALATASSQDSWACKECPTLREQIKVVEKTLTLLREQRNRHLENIFDLKAEPPEMELPPRAVLVWALPCDDTLTPADYYN
ncbi:hypothetical protein BIW11_06820, partial [Tropilaelaps mercedesae]